MKYKCKNCGHEHEEEKTPESGQETKPDSLAPFDSAQEDTDGKDDLKQKKKKAIAAVISKKMNYK